jgi:hypothetical protein
VERSMRGVGDRAQDRAVPGLNEPRFGVLRELIHQAGPALELDSWCGSSRLWPGRMATSSASKLDDASCARCDDDHAAERGGDE